MFISYFNRILENSKISENLYHVNAEPLKDNNEKEELPTEKLEPENAAGLQLVFFFVSDSNTVNRYVA